MISSDTIQKSELTKINTTSARVGLMEKFCQELPKVELHAHLNGSISDSTILTLLKQSNEAESFQMQKLTFEEGFSKFSLVHRLTNSLNVVEKITMDVISDFHKDNVAYLELRSTPRNLQNNSKREYVQTILNCIESYQHENDGIEIKFLLSINRQHSVEDAQETLKIAEEFSTLTDHVVGLDLSGDPRKGNIDDFIPVLTSAKNSRLKLALHVAEIPDSDVETEKLLNLLPDRIGHATYIQENTVPYEQVLRNKTPIEINITSNIMCGTAASVVEHHVADWYKISHPIIICTDDKGVFNTTLTQEYIKAAIACNLSCNELFNLTNSAVDHIFASNNSKLQLQKKFKAFASDHTNEQNNNIL